MAPSDLGLVKGLPLSQCQRRSIVEYPMPVVVEPRSLTTVVGFISTSTYDIFQVVLSRSIEPCSSSGAIGEEMWCRRRAPPDASWIASLPVVIAMAYISFTGNRLSHCLIALQSFHRPLRFRQHNVLPRFSTGRVRPQEHDLSPIGQQWTEDTRVLTWRMCVVPTITDRPWKLTLRMTCRAHPWRNRRWRPRQGHH
jgi:hypothetical protein